MLFIIAPRASSRRVEPLASRCQQGGGGATERVLCTAPTARSATPALEIGGAVIMLTDPFGHVWSIATGA
jgi:hypothetical protein